MHTLGSGSGLNGEGIRMSTLPALPVTTQLAESPGCWLFIILNGSELGIGDGGGNYSATTYWFSQATLCGRHMSL
jgi:hypothetical protein